MVTRNHAETTLALDQGMTADVIVWGGSLDRDHAPTTAEILTRVACGCSIIVGVIRYEDYVILASHSFDPDSSGMCTKQLSAISEYIPFREYLSGCLKTCEGGVMLPTRTRHCPDLGGGELT